MSGVVEVLVRAATFYTIDGTDITNAETIVIANKTYTAQDTLTDVDGNFHIGATIAATVTNLLAAINLSNQGIIAPYIVPPELFILKCLVHIPDLIPSITLVL